MNTKFICLSIIFLAILFYGINFQAFAKDDDGFELWRFKKTIAPDARDLTPLTIGDRSPYGTLITANGKDIDFENFIRRKPIILIFYQGAWSKDANRQMDQWVKLTPQLEALGYQVAAITPDQPSQLKTSMVQHHINYTLLSDSNMDVTRRFGLAFHADEDKFKKEGIQLKDYTGNTLNVLPLPAVYGLDKNGTIQFAFLYPEEDFGKNPKRLLNAAKNSISK